MKVCRLSVVIAVLLLASCAYLDTGYQVSPLDDNVLAANRSASMNGFSSAELLRDNDQAFENKLALINSATQTIDLAYYIFDDDYSSSVLSKALLDATRRGVNVRLLVDYHSAYKDLDRFSMLEFFGNRGSGSLRVKFYNRPTPLMIKDAIFMTLGCRHPDLDKRSGCSQEKLAEIDRLIAGSNDPANIRYGSSGLFLSGLYGKNPQLMALAVNEAHQLDVDKLSQSDSSADQADSLKKVGQIYWRAYYGSGSDRLVNRAKLSMAFLVYGDTLNPVYDAFSSFLPVEREQSSAARRDWDFSTDFLHHKLLWVDRQKLQLGGRNVQDAYHLQPSNLSDKYTFVDTDLIVELEEANNAFGESFERLWNYSMTASLADVRQHAPNDFLVAQQKANKVCKETPKENCVEQEFNKAITIPLRDRMEGHYSQLQTAVQVYNRSYQALAKDKRSSSFKLDPQATLSYIENLPYIVNDVTSEISNRHYGSINGEEGNFGKHIHGIWLSALKSVCQQATAESPQQIIFYNAYVFFPSNILHQLARMIDGREPCAHVTIDVLTNSITTTDLNVVNILSRHSIKALLEHKQLHHDPLTGARFRYFETPPAANTTSTLSLHSKVMVFGDRMFVGSANADARSLMMDTNNGLLIENAPQFIGTYRQWFNQQLADKTLALEMTQEYQVISRTDLLKLDEQAIDAMVDRYNIKRFDESGEQLQKAKKIQVDLLEKAYQLSKKIVGKGSSKEAQAEFNLLFKLI